MIPDFSESFTLRRIKVSTNLYAGLWSMDITPPMNVEMAGGVFDGIPIQGYKTRLYVNTLVMDDGINETAIISMDTALISNKTAKNMIQRISKQCGLKEENIIIVSTHTHKGPTLQIENYDVYTENTVMLTVTSVYMAHQKKQPIRIGVDKGKNDRFVFNRRLRKPDGSIVSNFVNPDFIKDCTGDGAVDSDVFVISIENLEGNPIGFIINYANHNNAASGNYVNSDISGHIGSMLKNIYGDETVTVFIPGACGNTNWINFKDESFRTDRDYYVKIATSLTGTILKLVSQLVYPVIDNIKVKREIVIAEERPHTEYDTKIDKTWGPDPESYKPFIENMKKSIGKKPEKYYIPLHAVKFGKDIAISSSPFELFAEYGLEIKQKSRYKYTLVATLANGEMRYLPTPAAFEEGGYEVRKPVNLVSPETGPEIINRLINLLNQD
jgi:neutral ceramidase